MTKVTIQDIVKAQLCTGCGVCVSESIETGKMIWNNQGFLVPSFEEENFAVRVCPFNTKPDEVVKDEDALAKLFLTTTTKKDEKVGKYVNSYVGYSYKYRPTSSSGGIATYIFETLLQQKIVDHLFIVKEVNGTYEYSLFSNAEQILKISKTRYIPVTLEKLFTEINKIDGRIAVSGISCFIKAIRLKQHYHPELKDKIPFLIGIICGGLKSRFFTDYLAQSAGIQNKYLNQEYRIKDAESTASNYSFGAFDEENVYHQMKMRTVGDMWGTGLFKSNACDFCDDVTTELADISLGDAWISPYNSEGLGNSVMVTRSELAENLIRVGIQNKELHVETLPIDHFIASQAASFKHRQLGMKYRLNLFKKKSATIPYKRKRFLQSIPFEYQWVQKQRMLLRKESLIAWQNVPESLAFQNAIQPGKSKLITLTRFYHRMQKLRRILKLKTI